MVPDYVGVGTSEDVRVDERDSASSRDGGMPIHYTSFVGREREIAATVALLERGSRLVTVVGPGGVGKTRMAVEVAKRLAQRFTNGSRFVGLEAIANAELVLPAIATRVGIGDAADRRDLAHRIANALRHGPSLLVLDNVEHLLAAASDLRGLLDASDDLVILATSRAPLRLDPERLILLDPLPLPEPESATADVWANPAVRLFAERAQAVGGAVGAGDVEMLAEIVHRLDGLPLAIELAAARMWEVRSLADLRTRLAVRLPPLTGGRRDAAERQRTLHDAIAWSYDLLTPELQALFRRLSVFIGGFSAEFAVRIGQERLAGAPFPFADGNPSVPHDSRLPTGDPFLLEPDGWTPARALALSLLALDPAAELAALVDASLVKEGHGREGETRYAMLETVREFGLDCLQASGEAEAVRCAHAGLMAGFSERSTAAVMVRVPHLWGIGRVDDEWSNLRSAIEWCETREPAMAELAVRIADPLWSYLQMRGLAADGCRWIEDALDRAPINPWCRVNALNAVGFLSWVYGDDARAQRVLHQSLSLARSLDYDAALGRALFFRSLVAWRLRRYDEMAESLEEAMAAYQRAGDFLGPGTCILAQGVLARIRGEPARAKALFDQAYAMFTAVGYTWGIATSRYYAGEAMRDLDDATEAARLLREGLDGYWSLRDGWGTGAVVNALAVLAVGRSERERGARLFGAAESLLDRAGAFLPPTELDAYRRVAAEVHGELGDAVYDAAFAAGRSLTADDAVAAARAVASELVDGVPPCKTPSRPAKSSPGTGSLTPRQLDVVRLLAEGLSVKEIANELHIGQARVYEILGQVRERLGARSDTEIVAIVVRAGIA